MLHILLTIIKLIGIILASILGLVVLILCLLLFVPIRYHLTGKKTEVELDGKGQVSWFLKILCVNFYLNNKDFNYEIKIFGISLAHISEFLKRLLSFCRRKKISSVREIKKGDNNSGKDILSAVEKKKTEQKNDASKEKKAQEQKKSFDVKKRIFRFPSEILKRIYNIRLTISSVCDKINNWIRLLQEETTKEAWNLVKIQLAKLIKHIIPRKMRGNVTFGFADPATTGRVLAGICVFYPLYYEQINISPDFTQTIFVGDLDIKGRIYLWVLLKMGIRIYFDKNIQYIKRKLSDNSNK